MAPSILDLILSVVFMIIGAYSITLKPKQVNKTVKEAKSQNFIVRIFLNKFLKPLRYSNKLIGQSVEKNSVILFGGAIIVLFLYYFIIGLFFFLIKYIAYAIIGMKAVFSLSEAFSLLFGAGISSTIIWLQRLKATKQNTLKAKISDLTRTMLLFIVLTLWSYGEIRFLIMSPNLAFADGLALPASWYSKLVVILLGIFGAIVVFLLIKWSVTSKKAQILILVLLYPIFLLFLFVFVSGSLTL